MPIIRQNWPGITKVLNRAAGLCAQADELMQELGAQDLGLTNTIKDGININALKQLSSARQCNVLRFWLRDLNLPIPSEVKIQEILSAAVNSRVDANPIIAWPGVQIRRFNGNLYAMSPLLEHNHRTILPFNIKKTLKLPNDLGRLSIEIDPDVAKKLAHKKFSVRFRTGGEKVLLPNRKGTHELKKLLQEWQVPPWQRGRIPLVYCADQIIAVLGFYTINGVNLHIT
jgi:tRNA(Ile)-lysidine synthase